MKEITPEELNDNIFKLIGKDWLLITSKKEDKVNMMTASWGQAGIMWNKPVVNIFIRKSRFTKSFIDENECFTLCVLPEQFRDAMTLCGRKSGRDTDKVKETGLTVKEDNGLPYFEESRIVLECKKLFVHELPESEFIGKELFSQNYANGDLHTMYIAQITKILVK